MFLLRYKYSLKYNIFKDGPDILCVPHRIRHASRPKQGLWWTVTANTMRGKSVARTWAQRRLRVAFVKALKSQGWDREGKVARKVAPLDGDGLNAGRENERGDLKGTLEVHTLTTILQATGEQVQREAELLVGIVARKCGSLKHEMATKQKSAGSIA